MNDSVAPPQQYLGEPGPREFAIVIGAMKSGTSSLFDLLAQHPEVAPCRVKEPDFYSECEAPTAEWDRYTALWDWNAERHKVALEASVSYTKAPWVSDVPRRMSSVSGVRRRFIYMMRNPMRRIESQVRHGLFAGWGESLDSGMSDDLLDFSRYAMQLDEYMKFFPRDAFLLLTLESLAESANEVLERCCHFLGVNPEFDFQRASEPRNEGTYFEVSSRVASITNNPVIGTLARRLLPRRTRHGIRRALSKRFGRDRQMGRWRLTRAEEEHIVAELMPDMARLSNVYGVEVPDSWTRVTASS